MNLQAYISGMGLISPQDTNGQNNLPGTIRLGEGNLLRCVEPVYSNYLNPVMARRMGRVIKMGIAASVMCLKDGGVEKPDAVITGTGLGCLGETEKFLLSVIRDDEQYLTPTSFIQSLQNSIAGQVAMHVGCTRHNFTFAHKGFSFESALVDAMMLLEDGEAKQVLAGGIDEMSEQNFRIYKKLGHWKQNEASTDKLLEEKTPGTIGGEGAAFFLLTPEINEHTYAKLEGLRMLYKPSGTSEVSAAASQFLEQQGLNFTDIDLVLYGYNGDIGTDGWYDALRESCFLNMAAAGFKHLCGEYQTSGGFALWLAAIILKNQIVPGNIKLGNLNTERLSRILIYNFYGDDHSLMLVSAV